MGTTASGGQEKEYFGKEARRQVEEEVKKITREHGCCEQIERRRKGVLGTLAWSYAKLGGTWRAQTRLRTTSGTSSSSMSARRP